MASDNERTQQYYDRVREGTPPAVACRKCGDSKWVCRNCGQGEPSCLCARGPRLDRCRECPA
jgi:hypothetical protein